MRKIITALLFIAVLGFIGYEIQQHIPKSLKQVNIPQHVFVKELMIIDSDNYAQGDVALLYKGEKTLWIHYFANDGRIRDMVCPMISNEKSYNAIKFLSEDSCRLMKLE